MRRSNDDVILKNLDESISSLNRGHGSTPPNFRGDLEISDQKNWEGPEQKIKFRGGRGGGAKFKGGPKILGGL